MLLHNNGRVEAYGENAFGQIGNCTNQNNNKIEELVQVERVDNIAVGDNHTLFLKTDRRVFTTGKNDFGQLGIGNRNNSKIPKLTWGIENIVQISAGNSFSGAVTSDGFVYTWGQNESGCLGHSKSHFVDRPDRIEVLDNVKAIALGFNYVLALGYDGTVKGWGENNYGQLGVGFKSKHNEIAQTLYKDVKQVACGRNFSVAVLNNGRVMGVGMNSKAQLGYEGEKIVLFPQEIPGLKDIDKIVAQGDFVIALDQMGNIYSWGQYSPVDNDYSVTPMVCDQLKYVKDIAATQTKGYAILEDGSIYEFNAKYRNLRKLDYAESKEHEN
jgi:alpha-tubulin suppressor-like RCC1 family protein